MEGERFDGLARKLQFSSPTRRTLTIPLVALAVAARSGFGTIPDRAVAKKGKKRKKTCKKPKPGPTCPGACPDTCHLCATRREGSPICGDAITFTCADLCTADNDCVGTVFKGVPVPYCISGYTPSGGQIAPLGCDGACAGLTTCQ